MSQLFKTQAVLFDMDGVIVDSEPLWEQAECDVLHHYGVDRNQLIQRHGIVTTGMRINEVIDMYCRCLNHMKLDKQKIANAIIDRAIDKITTAHPLLPGVKQALALCHQLGLKVGLASSSPQRVIDTVTSLFAITDDFAVRVSAEHLICGKPHPAVYLLAAEQIGISPLNCLTIEDSLAGMIATKAASMKSIVIPESIHAADPRWCLADYQLASLSDLTAAHLT